MFTYTFIIAVLVLVFVITTLVTVMKNQQRLSEQVTDLDKKLDHLRQDLWKSSTVFKRSISQK